MERIHLWVTSHIPFMAMFAMHVPPNRPMLTRIAEQAIVGVVAAALGIYVNDVRQQGQIESLSVRVGEVQQAQKESMIALNQKIDQLYRDLYVPRGLRGK